MQGIVPVMVAGVIFWGVGGGGLQVKFGSNFCSPYFTLS